MSSSSTPRPSSAADAHLELRLVSDIIGEFFVPRYQRGYRWGAVEVERLLDDVLRSGGKRYCLQPIVVKRRVADQDVWELVDGQQRLTTLYLLFLYMQREKLQSLGPAYSLSYETRDGSAAYLQSLDPARKDENIDFFHLQGGYARIHAWFEAHGRNKQHIANKLYGYFFESVYVIWYEAPHDLDSTSLFTRLNVGRIPLTDAELVKALLLSRSRSEAGASNRIPEIAAQWDAIERDLRDDDVWSFASAEKPADCPTRIDLILDAIAEAPPKRLRPRFFTFDALRARIESEKEGDGPEAVWNRVVDMHALVLGWFRSRDHYHKIGYLVALGHPFAEIVKLASGRTRKGLQAALDERITAELDLTPSAIEELGYETDGNKEKCHRVLLLMNVETVRRMEHSTERYSFRMHRSQEWSLEHIHAQNAEGLTKASEWKTWLDQHRAALETLPVVDEAPRDALVARIDELTHPVDRQTFATLSREVAAIFSGADPAERAAVGSVHSISNLALLSCGDNAALNNAAFEVKRRRIIELDKKGAYIPICTRQVFLKYFTGADAQQVHFWSMQDRDSYLAAIVSDEGVRRYLKAEEQHP